MKMILQWDEAKNMYHPLRPATQDEISRLKTCEKLLSEIKSTYANICDKDIDDYYISWSQMMSKINKVREISPIKYNVEQYCIAW